MGLNDMQQIDHLRDACAALYGNDPAQRRAADTYLKTSRSREGFWVQAVQLLTSAASTPQEHFFSAHALRTAAARAQDLEAPEPGQALAVRLAQLIVEAAACEQWAVVNQLAGALARVALRAMWWPVERLVPDVLHLLGAPQLLLPQAQQQQPSQLGQLGADRLQAVLVVLAALPEACLSRDVSMHPDRRSAATAALAKEAAVGLIAEHALGQAAMPSCQLAALQLVQSWSALPAAAPALTLSEAVVGGMHEAVLASPTMSTPAAEALAALFGACVGTGGGWELLCRLLLFLEGTVSGALQVAAACQRQDPQRAMQLLNAGITLLSAAGAALIRHLCEVVGGGAAAGLRDLPLQAGHGTQQARNGQSHLHSGMQQEQRQQQQQQQSDAAQLWGALGFVAGSLLELLQHPDVEVALAALQPWDDSLLPGLDRMLSSGAGTEQHGQQALHCQRAQQLLERLCGGLLQRMTLRDGAGPGQATADARDLPADVRLVRKEGSESFRVAAAALGAGEAVAHLLQLSAQACTSWQASSDPGQGWQQLECCLYALNLLLPRHLAVQRQQGGAAAQQAQQAAWQALKLCQAALTAAAPKLAGTALTLLGGMPEALLQQPDQPGGGNPVGSEAQECQAQVVAQLLAAVLGLLESPDAKLSRNAATAVHRLTSNASLAEHLVAQHAAWPQQLAQLYCSQGGLRQPPAGGEDLSKEEFMLRALCQLARSAWRAAEHAQQGQYRLGMGQAGSQAGVSSLAGLLLRQAAALAQDPITQLQQCLAAPGCQLHAGQQPSAGMVAAARQCGIQLEVMAVVLQVAFPPGAQLALEQALADAWGTAQMALQLLPALHQQQQAQQQQQQEAQAHPRQPPYTKPLLLGCCHVLAAAARAAPWTTAQSALPLLRPLLADPPHSCLLQALRAVIASVVAVQQPLCSPEGASEQHGLQACAEEQQQQQQRKVLLSVVQAVMLAFQGCSQHAEDPEWSAPALLLGAAAARLLPQLQFTAAAGSSGCLTHQLLSAVRRGAQSYHRNVCEAALELAAALCCSIAVVQQSQAPASGLVQLNSGTSTGQAVSAVQQADSVAAQLVLALLLGASGAMPPFMMMPVADALHSIWATVGTDRFGPWLSHAVIHLAPPDAPWSTWKQEAIQSALGELLGCGDDSKRFKRQLKVLCGGKKKGRHVDVPARGVGA